MMAFYHHNPLNNCDYPHFKNSKQFLQVFVQIGILVKQIKFK